MFFLQLVAVDGGGILQQVVGFEVKALGDVVTLLVAGVMAGVSSGTRVSFQAGLRVLVVDGM